MRTWREDIVEHAENELEISNLKGSEVGNAMLALVKAAVNYSNDPADIKSLGTDVFTRLIDRYPITELKESDFSPPDINGRRNCKRYRFAYQEFGKFYDDRSMVWMSKYDKISKQYIYDGLQNSKTEITLPYFPKEKVIFTD